MSSLYIVIPAYNESENIEKTIDQWYPVVERHNDEGNSRLVIINDGSKDNTYELLQKCAATRPLLIPLDKPNGGHGPTVLYGYRYAIRQKADIFSRLIQTVRRTLTNSSHSGTRGAGMMQ